MSSYSIVRAKTDRGELAVAVPLPVGDEMWEQLSRLANVDGLAQATWTATPSDDRDLR